MQESVAREIFIISPSFVSKHKFAVNGQPEPPRISWEEENAFCSSNKLFSSQKLILTNKKETRLTEALTESRKIISENVNNANEKSKNLTDNAKLASQQKVTTTKIQLQEQEKEIANALSIQDIAQSISDKILAVEIKND